MRHLALTFLVSALLPIGSAFGQEEPSALDLLTFAQGVLPVSIDTGEADLRTDMTHAIGLIDGNWTGIVITPKPGTKTDRIEIVYSLPAPTRFERFAVPNVLETPSPSQTFFSNVEVLGSAEAREGPFVLLAQGELGTHEKPDSVTQLTVLPDQPEVLWIKLRLTDGLSIESDKTFFEFSELIGNGVQQTMEFSDRFGGVWEGRGVDIELAQDGASVTGCYDRGSRLEGTVQGKVLRALGSDKAGIASQFILITTEEGALKGLRSTNGAPFKPYDGDASSDAPACLPSEPPAIGCGSIVHGIGFDFDSDTIRAGSEPLIASLYEGLTNAGDVPVQIIGHSSSEGEADYNRDLSQRRANSVVEALIALGLDASRMSAVGRGEDQPIASNDDEAGRSINRRVEIQCNN